MDLVKGAEFWRVDFRRSYRLGDGPVLRRGVVVGGGDEIAIVEWDELLDEWDPKKERVQRRKFESLAAPTREEAIRLRLDALDQADRDASARVDAIRRNKDAVRRLA